MTEISVNKLAKLNEPLTVPQAAELTGFSQTYLRRLCPPAVNDSPTLNATLSKDNGRTSWLIDPSVLADFIKHRQAPSTRACFDMTFTMEKSVSLLGLLSTPDIRASVVEAVLAANSTGVDHLNFNASNARNVVR